jgi:hypothetical protein
MERKFSSSNYRYSPIFGTSSEGFYALEKNALICYPRAMLPIQDTGRLYRHRQFRDNEA